MVNMNLQNFGDEQLTLRANRLSFMNVGTSAAPSYKRMTKFTSLSKSKNPAEYSRKYVDMTTESSDVVGYAEAVAFTFDLHTNNSIHTKLAGIADEEKTGADALVEIVTVDIFGTAPYVARKRTYSAIPDKEDDGTDALQYSGNFKAVSEIEVGTAATSDGWQTITYTAPTTPTAG